MKQSRAQTRPYTRGYPTPKRGGVWARDRPAIALALALGTSLVPSLFSCIMHVTRIGFHNNYQRLAFDPCNIVSCIEDTLDTMKGEDDCDNLNGVLSMSHWLRKVYKPNENPKSRTRHSHTEKEKYPDSINPGT